MAQEITLYQKCNICRGDGVVTSTGSQNGTPQQWETPCTSCEGTGYVEFGHVSLDPGFDDIMDRCNDILDKCNDIKEKVDEL